MSSAVVTSVPDLSVPIKYSACVVCGEIHDRKEMSQSVPCATHAPGWQNALNQLVLVNAASIIDFLFWKNAISVGERSSQCSC